MPPVPDNDAFVAAMAWDCVTVPVSARSNSLAVTPLMLFTVPIAKLLTPLFRLRVPVFADNVPILLLAFVNV